MKKVFMVIAIVVAASAVVALIGAQKESEVNDEDDGTILDYLGV